MDPTEIAGRFEVERVAGSGGLGVVYRCVDRRTGAPVAVKVAPRASASSRERFLREAEMLSTIEHPNVVRYVAHGLLDTNEPWLAMEWLDGEDLHDRLERAPLGLAESIALGRKLAAALGAAHARGIVHRDVKPANVVLVGDDPASPKLIDFGIARAGLSRLTQPGGILGTPGYMAPEQARGEPTLDARADVFALGCLLYECISGRRAFDGDSAMAILAKVLLEDPPRLRAVRPDVPPALEHAVDRMLAKTKESRYASAVDVARDLDRLDVATEEAARSVARVLTSRERKLLCVLVARRGEATEKDATIVDSDDAPDATAVPDATAAPGTPDRALRDLAASLGSSSELLVDGSIVVVFEGTAAVDQAVRAARAALRLRAHDPALRLAIATGRGEVTGALPVGAVVDRACALEEAPRADGVRVDPLTADLIEGRFEKSEDPSSAVLRAELESESVRSLLGKSSPFVGRDRELGTLLAVFAEVKDESAPRLALVTGDAGTGKSRLRVEIAGRLRGEDALWLFGGGDVSQPGAPFGALRGALRRELGARPGASAEERRLRIGARLRETAGDAVAERIAPLLAHLAGAPFDEGEGGARVDALATGDALRAAWHDFLEAEGRARPVVLVLEDMQWGDRPSLSLALGALRALPHVPLWVVVTGRPDVFATFPDLRETRGLTHVELAPLGGRASRRLLGELLPDADDATLERLGQHAGGNPFLLEELARAVAQGRGAELPETVLATAQARLSTLSPVARRVLRAAAALGEDVMDDALAALLVDLSPEERAARIADVVREEILERDPADPRRLRFRQVLLREASYASLTEADRKLAHALAASWLSARAGANPVALATHFERGGNLREASAHYVAAAEQALEGSDVEGALRLLARADAQSLEGETLGRLLLARGDALRQRGETENARDAFARATKLLHEGGRAWIAAKVGEATTAVVLGDPARLHALALLLCVLLEGGDVSSTVVNAGARVATFFGYYRTSGEVPKRLFRALRAAMPRCKDERSRGLVLAAIAGDAYMRDDLEESCDGWAAGAEASTRARDLRAACTARVNLGYMLTQLGQWERAEAELREGLAIAERAGIRANVAIAQQNLGMTLARRGDLDAGEACEREAVLAFEDQGDMRLTASSRYYLARILTSRGRLDEAESVARRSCDDSATVPSFTPLMRAGLAFVLLARGKNEEALATAQGACALADASAAESIEEPRVPRIALARALVAAGCEAEGAELVRKLASELLDHAARLRDPAIRETFLHAIEDHADVLALHARLGA